jgi:hypothetical protein
LRARSSEQGQSIVEFALVLPLLLIIFLAVADFARVYTEMLTVESAVREAADFGAINSANWEGDWTPDDCLAGTNCFKTQEKMVERACIASRNLPNYEDDDDDPSTGCQNPAITMELTEADGSAQASTCGVDREDDPCRVVVTLTHTFHLISPLRLNVFGTNVGFPETMAFERTSIFAVSDFDLIPGE